MSSAESSEAIGEQHQTAALAAFLFDLVRTCGFVDFVCDVCVRSDEVQRIARDALAWTPDMPPLQRDLPSKVNAKGGVVTSRLRDYRDTILEMMICRIVDSYLGYLSNILTEMFRARPEMLRSEEQVTTEFVLRHASLEQLRESLAERKVDRLSYESFDRLAEYFTKRIGIDLFTNPTDLERARVLIENRNTIVHNRAIVNRRYLQRVPQATTAVGGRLTFDVGYAFDAATWLRAEAVRVDAQVCIRLGMNQPNSVTDSKQRQAGSEP